MSTHMNNFKNKLSEHGLNPEEIIIDGNIHRFKTDGKDLSGWYFCFQDNDSLGGGFGDWRTGLNKTYSEFYNTGKYDKENFLKKIKELKLIAEKERKELQNEAAIRANEIWNKSDFINFHDYLKKKQVKSYGLKLYKNMLVVPVRSEKKEIRSLQFISPDGEKRFLSDGEIAGNAFTIPGEKDRIFICEGYSTGATIAQVTGNMVICAFNAGNLKSVSKKLRNVFDGKIIIAADNDKFNEANIGVNKATDAANSINAKCIIPEFKSNEKLTDFNDLFISEGEQVVIEQLNEITSGLYSQVKKYIQSTNGNITINQLNSHFGFSDKFEKDNMLKIIDQLCKKNIIRKLRDKSFTYKIINTKTKKIDLTKKAEFLNICLPFSLEDFVNTPKGSIVIIAGDSNSGKTAASLDCLKRNIQYNQKHLTYFSSEMHDDEYKDRIFKIHNDIEFWDSVDFQHRSSDFVDLITDEKKDGINFIDYLEPVGDNGYAKLENDIADIRDSLKDGIAIINLQKTTGNEIARGGDGTKSKSRLYLSLSAGYKCRDGGWVNICKIIKNKIHKKNMQDIDGMSCLYRANARGIERLTFWQYMNKDTKKQFLEQMKFTLPEVDKEPVLMKIIK